MEATELLDIMYGNRDIYDLWREYKRYYEEAQTEQERRDIEVKFHDIVKGEYGREVGYMNFSPHVQLLEEREIKPRQDIKGLKIMTMILTALVIYLLAKK